MVTGSYLHISYPISNPVSLGQGYIHEDTQERRLRLLCLKYWGRGDAAKSEIFQTQTIVVPSLDEDQLSYPIDAIMVGSAPDHGVNSIQAIQIDATTSVREEYTILSLGNDFNGMFGAEYNKILVRDEYPEMLKFITADFDRRSKGIVVTGQPGIGKYPIWSISNSADAVPL